MTRLARPLALAVGVLLAGCGSRSGLLDDEPRAWTPAPPASDASVPLPDDDASVPEPPPEPPPAPPGRELEPAIEVSAGLFHSCAATRVGRVHCWGFNNLGQLGDGTGEGRPLPVASPGVADAIAVTAGRSHSCALREGGEVLCWGSNLAGQLGSGTFETRHLLPVPVDGLTGVTRISAGGEHTCALTADGRLFCWGSNENGQVGPDMAGTYRRPVAVPLDEPVRDVAAGFEHTCAIGDSGRVLCWGEAAIERTRPRLEDELVPPFRPTEVTGMPPAVTLTSGDFESCAIAEGGGLYCWGFARERGEGEVRPRVAARVPGLDDAVQVSAGHEFACALRRDGRVACWGNNERGQLGDGGADETPGAMVEPIGLPRSTVVTSGWRHACALDAAGAVRCWGRDWEGQLGDGLGGEHRLPTVAAVFRD